MSHFNLSKFLKPKRFTFGRKSSRKLQLGFTLIELLVAIVIITILTTVGIASFNGISRSNATFQKGQELQSLVRKLRSDATAAVKPVTGATTATSCKSVDASSDLGILYGSYIIFDGSTTPPTPPSYIYGISCFNGGIDVSSASPTQNLPDNMVLTIAGGNRLRIYYDFLGQVYYTVSNSAIARPDSTYVLSPATSATGPIPAAPISLIVSYSGTTSPAYIYFSATGLVCVQKSVTAPTCAG